jgi:hypothetical protein
MGAVVEVSDMGGAKSLSLSEKLSCLLEWRLHSRSGRMPEGTLIEL